ncbi:hypothetical protein NQ315_009253 [Exocentrus adspersus]|uniref:Chitin-binding type-2 domain-containing protein n=1 Tax=Exocentrus adspersus TaxID=1586481 RepID=A0AAV8WI51_9CUCU|nr:hypothetical protein NQ315_009253 [Exocentrus adspersus]
MNSIPTMNKFLLVFVILTMPVYQLHACGTNNIQCVTQTTYQFCFTVGTQLVLGGNVYSCPNGTICSESGGSYACVPGVPTTTTTTTTTTSTTTTTVAPPAACTASGRYRATNCNQYYECVPILWWFDLVLQTCGTNLAYDATSQQCTANSTCFL